MEQRFYIMTILDSIEGLFYNKCITEIESKLSSISEEAYILSNRFYIIISTSEYSEIVESLKHMKYNYSYVLLDATESILTNKFNLDITNAYKKDPTVISKLNSVIEEFKSNNKIIPSIILNESEVTDQQKMDLILDKISFSGKSSLSPEDLKFLDNFVNL